MRLPGYVVKHQEVFTVTVAYLAFASLWVVFSDLLLEALVDDPQRWSRYQIIEEWLLVIVTTGLLFYWVRLAITRSHRLLEQHRRYEVFASNCTEALMYSEQRYRSIVEDQTEFVVRWKFDGRLTFVNDSYCHFLHKSRELLLGTSFFPHIHPDDLSRFLAMIHALSPEDPIAKPYEERVVVPCGDVHWTQWIDRAIFDAKTGEVEYQSVGRDVTELKQTVLALKQANEEVGRLKDRLLAENVYLQEEIKTEHDFTEIIGQSAELGKVLDQIKQVAPTEATVLIQGESGTGKELIARAIHHLSSRKNRPLVKVNCAAISAGLVESELFGHEKGAFTGAVHRRIGRFELADGGTLFLDEIGDLSEQIQVKLLRVLQEREFERVGSSRSISVDVRLIAATHRNLVIEVESGAFREDLYYRLNVFPVELPPLRARFSDIPLLVDSFMAQFAKQLDKPLKGVSKRTMKALMEYPWPGNIRELRNIIERAAIVARSPILEIEELLASANSPTAAHNENIPQSLEDVERRHILQVLERSGWVISGKQGAATILKIHPNTLRSRMQRLAIKLHN